MHAPKIRPIMIPEFLFEKGVWSGSRDTVIFWALNANSSKMVEAIGYRTDFKFVSLPIKHEAYRKLNIANNDQVTYDVM